MATLPEMNQVPEIRFAVFDADGVVVNGKPISERLKELPGFDFDTFNNRFFASHGPEGSPFRRIQADRYGDIREVLADALAGTGWPGIDESETRSEAVINFLRFWFEGDSINQELVEKIKKLKDQGIAVYMGTNQERYKAAYLKHVLGVKELGYSLSEAFGEKAGEPHILASVNLGAIKPNREYFWAAMDEIQRQEGDNLITTNQVIFFDDDNKNVAAARDFGWNAVYYGSMNDFDTAVEQFIK